MKTPREGPGALDGAAGRMTFAHPHHTAPTPLEAYALGALAVYPEARARLRELGCAPATLFHDENAARLGDVIIEECASIAEAMAASGDIPAAQRWIEAASAAAEGMERADGAAWAVAVVERLAEDHARHWAPTVLRWGADALERGWEAPARVRETIRAVLDLACGEQRAERKAVAA